MNWGHKYKAKTCERDGFKFSSQKEARYYDQLKMLQDKGDVLFFLRQIPIYLSPSTKYVMDFLVFYENGKCEFIDVKGYDTTTSKTKRNLVEDFLPVKIKIV